MNRYPPDTIIRNFKLSKEAYVWLKQHAKNNTRSITAELYDFLEKYIKENPVKAKT